MSLPSNYLFFGALIKFKRVSFKNWDLYNENNFCLSKKKFQHYASTRSCIELFEFFFFAYIIIRKLLHVYVQG